jgi:hypothetical protein
MLDLFVSNPTSKESCSSAKFLEGQFSSSTEQWLSAVAFKNTTSVHNPEKACLVFFQHTGESHPPSQMSKVQHKTYAFFFCASAYNKLARVALLEERQQFWTSTTLLSQLAPFFRFSS